LLPKGRKDHGESVPATAVRETFEETGYPCELLPLDLITRAPAAGAQTEDAAVTVGGSGEPFMVTLRRTKDGGIQILSWFATVCTAGADKVVGSVPDRGGGLRKRVDEALRVATFQVDRDVIARAVELVRATHPEASDIERPQPCHSKL
jgi:8-oxo-dGTP pyrophosphatase MutT (NUDIX family)